MNNMALRGHAKEKREAAVQEERQYVTFMIDNENYALPVLKVQEIIGMTDIVYVPNSPDFIKGVINLRGSVVPVVDMRKRFHMGERVFDMFTVIIIVEINEMPVGMIVDSVSDVINIPQVNIQVPPQFSARIKTDFINGIAQVNEKLVIILDIEKVFTIEEIKELDDD
ncbi:MAG: hypothetical protein A2W19_08900 [Spirochaetes bacterium RBG_16_49_21]|nr:MAG: hypothetical protein A2W19_08900 [Spirochaetes bacterium RBG_16_49_21]